MIIQSFAPEHLLVRRHVDTLFGQLLTTIQSQISRFCYLALSCHV